MEKSKTHAKQVSKPAGTKKENAKDTRHKAKPGEGRPVRHSSANSSATQGKRAASSHEKPPSFPPRKPTEQELAYRDSLEHFEKGLALFSQNEFAKARTIFQKLAEGTAADVAERGRVYLNICNQRLARPALQLKAADDFYNYGVQMANEGDYETAEQNLIKALKLSPKADYIIYALATTQAQMGKAEESLESLKQAIALNDRSRYLAQNDPDFSSLQEDPRFTELIYPEVS